MTDEAIKTRRRVAVVLFNIGGPDSLAAVRPFLYNLFSDPAIITLPAGPRHLVAALLAWRRAPVAREIYSLIGGRSPIEAGTRAQAEALEKKLNAAAAEEAGDNREFRCFTAMRYWRPRAWQTLREVKDFAPDDIFLLPLFPQYSTTTTGTAFAEWQRVARAAKLDIPTRCCCCYPLEEGFVEAHTTAIKKAISEKVADRPFRLLLSAHSLPQKIIAAGDPYAWQIDQTASALIKRLCAETGRDHIDYRVCYQSRVGPLKWLEPDTRSEIRRAGAEGLALILVPIAFVSEHSETLVELDIEYAKLAEEAGVPLYHRVPALGTDPRFIEALAAITLRRLGEGGGFGAANGDGARQPNSSAGHRLCPAGQANCYLAGSEKEN